MFCLTQNLPFPPSSYFLYYCLPQNRSLQQPTTVPANSPTFSQFQPNQRQNIHFSNDKPSPLKGPKIIPGEALFCLSTDSMSQKKKQVQKNSLMAKREIPAIDDSQLKEVKLDFRIQWKNENRNIVPNLTNQMISFVLKKSKSQKLVKKLFQYISHNEKWTERKFYHYMKKIKESVTHYVNQNAILKFLEIHEPKCQLYEYQEQLFYMRICRLLIMKFLQNDAILISLTSNRMSSAKRMIHLIARDALKRKFLQLCKQHMF